MGEVSFATSMESLLGPGGSLTPSTSKALLPIHRPVAKGIEGPHFARRQFMSLSWTVRPLSGGSSRPLISCSSLTGMQGCGGLGVSPPFRGSAGQLRLHYDVARSTSPGAREYASRHDASVAGHGDHGGYVPTSGHPVSALGMLVGTSARVYQSQNVMYLGTWRLEGLGWVLSGHTLVLVPPPGNIVRPPSPRSYQSPAAGGGGSRSLCRARRLHNNIPVSSAGSQPLPLFHHGPPMSRS